MPPCFGWSSLCTGQYAPSGALCCASARDVAERHKARGACDGATGAGGAGLWGGRGHAVGPDARCGCSWVSRVVGNSWRALASTGDSRLCLTHAAESRIVSPALRDRGYSSAGRALDWQSRGQGFESPYLHQRLSGPGHGPGPISSVQSSGDWLRGRAHPSHGWGRRFKSCIAHHLLAETRLVISLVFFVCHRCMPPGAPSGAAAIARAWAGGGFEAVCAGRVQGRGIVRTGRAQPPILASQALLAVHNLASLPSRRRKPRATSNPCPPVAWGRAQSPALARRLTHVTRGCTTLPAAMSRPHFPIPARHPKL